MLKIINNKRVILVIALITLLIYVVFYASLLKHGNKDQVNPMKTFKNIVNINTFEGEKIVHLDLKGAPPKISYYDKLFPLLASLGATGVLIEYEDMFPYSGPYLNNISALNCYTLQDIKFINKLAQDNKLKIIPLVQTFGHLEFILKLDEYKQYREVPLYPQAICPSHKNTLNLIMDMIDQIIDAHDNIQMLHIGCDEVYHLGMCERCTNRMHKYDLTKNSLYLEYVNSITKMIHNKYPHIRVLVWDDHIRSMSDLGSNKFEINIEPVVWEYGKDVYDKLGPSLWTTYFKKFKNVWIASAFKGATGSDKIAPDVSYHVQNHRSWLSVITDNKHLVHFEGIFITGWQRYDHFSILCELLPVGIPSLAMSLRILQGFKGSLLSRPTDVAKILQCDQPFALMGSAFGSPKCKFPGGAILENVIHLQQLKLEFEAIMEISYFKGWMTDYNIQHAFSSPQYIEQIGDPLDKIKWELEQLEIDMAVAMNEIYDNYTIMEWQQTYIQPFKNQVLKLCEAKEVLLMKNVWPRRPIATEF